MDEIPREEVQEMKRVILRLCRERPRSLSPMGAGLVALSELEREAYVTKVPGGLYALTEKGERV